MPSALFTALWEMEHLGLVEIAMGWMDDRHNLAEALEHSARACHLHHARDSGNTFETCQWEGCEAARYTLAHYDAPRGVVQRQDTGL